LKQKCPNCGQFKFDEKIGRMGCSLLLIFGIPLFSLLVPGSSSFYGGDMDFEDMFPIMVISFVIGIILFILSIFFPSKTITYKCENCNFQETYSK